MTIETHDIKGLERKLDEIKDKEIYATGKERIRLKFEYSFFRMKYHALLRDQKESIFRRRAY